MVLLEASSFAGALGAVKLLDSRLRPYFTALATADARPAVPETGPLTANNRRTLEQQPNADARIAVPETDPLTANNRPQLEQRPSSISPLSHLCGSLTDPLTANNRQQLEQLEEERRLTIEVLRIRTGISRTSLPRIEESLLEDEEEEAAETAAETMTDAATTEATETVFEEEEAEAVDTARSDGDSVEVNISEEVYSEEAETNSSGSAEQMPLMPNRCDNFSNDFEMRGVQRPRIVSLPVPPNAINRQ